MGIEPTALAWEARVLPLYDARHRRHSSKPGWNRKAPARLGLRDKIVAMIAISINGERSQLATETTVAQLLQQLGYAEKRVAVEMNGAIVPKSRHGQARIVEGDRLEIVVAVGGG